MSQNNLQKKVKIDKSAEVIFASSSNFGIAPIKKLHKEGFSIVAILTKPSLTKTRGKKTVNNPILDFANNNNIKCIVSNKIDNQTLREIKTLKPKIIITASYGVILPKEFLSLFWVINLHSSLLPKFRGANPIRRAIEFGEKKTGVTIMEVEEKVDAGPIYLKSEINININDSYLSLNNKLSELAASMLVDNLSKLNTIDPKVQNHKAASYAKKYSKNEIFIDPKLKAIQNLQKILALYPNPCARYIFNNLELKILIAEIIQFSELEKLSGFDKLFEKQKHLIYNKQPIILCSDNGLIIKSLIVPGKKEIKGCDFINGYAWTK